ncbi:hypothetical protein DAPPUDRAFT_258479 [Daphnia pulex]|uniref:Uncharacterized protein n=1 Tax=Daphnia pulex TaxID=6669 RepID=E9HFG6_DAPPU|nr:hypothetical protein DAPPUDRAFT_258479 [Daphnia pulex]|eukprot:EFX69535.1 hypothetical protein DAPPUDRAFT_258479 [Daphnia pulex]
MKKVTRVIQCVKKRRHSTNCWKIATVPIPMTPDEYVKIGHQNRDDEQLESENELDEDHMPEFENIREYDVPDEDAILVDQENEEEAPIPNNTSPQTCKEYTLPSKTNNICQCQTYVYFGSVCIG